MENIIVKDKFSNFIIFIYAIIPVTLIAGSFLFELNLFFIILTLIYHLFKKKELINEIINDNIFKFFLILWLYLLLNIIISEDYSLSVRRNIFFIKFLFIIFSFKFFLKNELILEKVLLIWTIVLCIVSADVIFEFTVGHNMLGFISPMKNERVVSFFKDELIVGSYIFGFFFPIIGYYLYKKKQHYAFLLGILFTVAILLSGERSSFFKLLLSMILFVFFVLKQKKYKLILLLIFITLISGMFFNDKVKFRYFDTINRSISLDFDNLYNSALNTKYINQSLLAYEIFKENKLFGVGNKNYFNSCSKLDENLALNCYTHPHQFYYEFLSEHGLIGSLIIIIMIYLLLFKKNDISSANKNILFIFKIYCIISFVPLIPTGSFFSSYNLALFWINFSFFQVFKLIK